MWSGKFVRVDTLQVGDNFLTKSNHTLSVVAFRLKDSDKIVLTTRNHLTGKQRDGDWHKGACVFKIETNDE
jgi:hypothetical protein